MLPFTRLTLVIAIILLLPWLALIGFGGYWLWQQGWLYYGFGTVSASIALAYALTLLQRRSQRPLFIETVQIKANPNWAALDDQAWKSVKALSERWQQDANALTDPRMLMAMSNEVIATVAKHYHAESQTPILEFPLPYLLKLVVLVCEDMQRDVLDKIPGSHAIKVMDLVRAKQALDAVDKAKSVVAVGNWLFNWPGAALGKAQGMLVNQGMSIVIKQIKQRLLHTYINKLGYYAIQLYSGQIRLDDWAPTEKMTRYSQADSTEAASDNAQEPLRILLVGQISSGKSSLVNALFGHVKAAEGWLPTTAETTPYVLERDGLKQAIILDSAGYGGFDNLDATAAIKKEWAKTDVVLLVLKANQAAREADRQPLQAIRDYFQNERRNQALPEIIAVVTHIDLLRPIHEWQPPYNIQQPDNTKAQNIRHACDTIADDLQLPLSRIVPVCLATGRPAYNIDDGLIPVIHEHLDAAQRVRYLRCLRQQQAESYWRQWRQQAGKLGQVILDWA